MRSEFQKQKTKIFDLPLRTPHLILRTLHRYDGKALKDFCEADDASYIRRWDLWNTPVTPAGIKRKLRENYGDNNHLYLFRKGTGAIVGVIELYEDRQSRPRISYFTLPSERGQVTRSRLIRPASIAALKTA